MTTLIIAEKPSVGRQIAAVVGATKRCEGYQEGNGYVVSWCRGHLVDLEVPDSYEGWGGRWNYRVLPMIPETWRWAVRPGAGNAEQFATLCELIDRADVELVVNACDADREGEGILRRVWQLHPSEKPVRRFWSSSLVPEAIERDLENALPWSEYEGLAAAAEGRVKADWLVGLNATRAYVTTYHAHVSAGRVQTPVLALIVARTREAEAFRSQPFWHVMARFEGFVAKGERLEDKNEAVNRCMRAMAAGGATVVEAEYKDEHASAPKLYDLTNLQRDASELFGMTADETLAALQRLYEAKLVTYPRTDSRHITTEEAPEAARVLASVAQADIVGELVASAFDPARSSIERVVDDAKMMGHGALLPTRLLTSKAMAQLPEDQWQLAQLICVRLLVATMEPATKAKSRIVLEVDGHAYEARDTVVRDASWLTVEAAAKASWKEDVSDGAAPEEHKSLPTDLEPGMTLRPLGFEPKEGKTSAPKYYTDATLLSAMANAGRHVDDAELAAALDDDTTHPGGLGTPATRANIIERVISAGYAYRSGKQIVATQAGKTLIDMVDETLKTPELTAKWELELAKIERGEASLDAFLRDIEAYTAQVVRNARVNYSHEDAFALSGKEPIAWCPKCGKAVIKRGSCYQCVSNKYERAADGKWRIGAGCGFRVFETVAGKKLTERQMSSILNGKTVTARGFKRKDGSSFEAKLRLGENHRIEFVRRTEL